MIAPGEQLGSPATARYTCVVVGAGPAGLASSRELGRRGVQHLVLERGASAGHCWRNAYDSLRLHTGKHLSALPGLRFRRGTPLFPTRDDFVAYLNQYCEQFALPISFGVDVSRIEYDGEWLLHTNKGRLNARSLVMATGLMSNPVVPRFLGQDEFAGTITHSVSYRRPEDFA